MLTLSPLINSRIKGYVTPKKIEKIAVNIKILFIDKNDSLEPVTISFDDCIFGSLYANIPREIRVIKPENPNRYKPQIIENSKLKNTFLKNITNNRSFLQT